MNRRIYARLVVVAAFAGSASLASAGIITSGGSIDLVVGRGGGVDDSVDSSVPINPGSAAASNTNSHDGDAASLSATFGSTAVTATGSATLPGYRAFTPGGLIAIDEVSAYLYYDFSVDPPSTVTLTETVTGNNLPGSHLDLSHYLYDVDTGDEVFSRSIGSDDAAYVATPAPLTGTLYPGHHYEWDYTFDGSVNVSGGASAPVYSATLTVAPLPEPTTLLALASPLTRLTRRRRTR